MTLPLQLDFLSHCHLQFHHFQQRLCLRHPIVSLHEHNPLLRRDRKRRLELIRRIRIHSLLHLHFHFCLFLHLHHHINIHIQSPHFYWYRL